MKKIITSSIIFLALIFNTINISANESVIVSAVVWNINSAPIILNVNPSSNPRILATNKTQSYTITLSDKEKDTIYYTITPEDWYTNPISWIINPSDYIWDNAYINFLYLAPATVPSWDTSKITVTINDWPNVIVRDLNLYIY